MTGYQAILAVHVLAAVLGLGNIVAVAVLVSARPAPPPAPGLTTQLGRLLRLASGALGLLIASGALLMYFTRGLYVQMTWFRASTAIVLGLGVTLAIARRGLRPPKPGAPLPGPTHDPLARTRRASFVACGLAAVVVVLMVTKP